MTQTVLFTNDKGGVHKTGIVVQTAAAFARRGLKVLIVDMDPQANATRRLGIGWAPENPFLSVSEAIQANVVGAGQGAITGCGWLDDEGEPTPESERIDVIPARVDLINREGESGEVGAVQRLKKALGGGWTDSYDAVLIDSPRGLGHLSQMALAAANLVVIPCEPSYESVEGAIRVRDFAKAHAEDLSNPGLTVAGVLITRKRSTAEAEFQIEGVKERFGDLVWSLRTTRTLPGGVVQELTPDFIPEWTRFAEADAAAVSLSAWNDARGRTTVALFDQVARNIIERILDQVPNVPGPKVTRTYKLDLDLVQRAETAVLRAGAHRSMTGMVASALERELERLANEYNDGMPYPPNTDQFRTGRPAKPFTHNPTRPGGR